VVATVVDDDDKSKGVTLKAIVEWTVILVRKKEATPIKEYEQLRMRIENPRRFGETLIRRGRIRLRR